MKNLIIHLIFLFSITYISHAQSNCKSNIIRTNPEGSTCNSLNDTTAYNTEKTNKKNCNPVIFNWRTEFFDLNSYEVYPNPDSKIKSPFFQDDNTNVVDLVINKDFYSKDGWELIKQDFGYTDLGELDDVGHPYFILYNKYLGLLRVFIAVGRLEDYDGIKIEIFEDGTKFRTNLIHEPTSIKPLLSVSDYEGIQKNISVSPFLNEREKWFYADFVVHYDPCICFYKSLLHVDVHLIDNSTISLTGVESGTITSITNGQGTVDNTNKLRSFSDLTSFGSKVYESYNSFNQAKNEANETIDKWVDSLLISGNTGEMWKIDVGNALNWVAGKNSILRELSDCAGFIGVGFGIYDFFTGGPKNDGTIFPPLALRSKVELSGSIENASVYKQIVFWNPGCDNLTLTEDYYPYYNQVLGTFNLIRSPKLDRYINFESDFPGRNDPYDVGCTVRQEQGYKLSSNLEYVINPAAGVSLDPDDIEILCSYEFNFDSDDPYTNSVYYNLDPMVKLDNSLTYITEFVPFQCLDELKIIFDTGEYPIYVSPYDPEPYMIYPESIYLKLIVKMKKINSSSENDFVVFVGKYPVELNTITKNPNDWQSIYFNYPQFLELSNTVLTQDKKVWDYVNLGPNISFLGCNLITAGKSIKVTPGTIIDPNVELVISQPIECTNQPYAPVSEENIESFCYSNAVDGYKPELRDALKSNSDEDNSDLRDVALNRNEIFLPSPNPASEKVKFSFTLAKSSVVNIILVDVLGNEIENIPTKCQSGYNAKLIDLTKFSAGVYTCIIRTSDTKLITKVIKL